MSTEIIRVNPKNPDKRKIASATAIIRGGGTVAFPTETVYGLGANALDVKAVKKIFDAKGRPADNPLIVHISNIEELAPLVTDVPDDAKELMELFWPGPFTLILPKSMEVPGITTGGLDTVAVRIPDHPVALELISQAGVPIAAPSANISGRPSPTRAEHVIEDLSDRIDAIIDGGPSRVGVESTVLDLSSKVPVVLRPGGITVEMLKEILRTVEVYKPKEKEKKPLSPGVKYRHYAPRGDVILFVGRCRDVAEKMIAQLEKYPERRMGLMVTRETSERIGNVDIPVEIVGSRYNLEHVAENLFYVLRKLDEKDVEIILAEGFNMEGVGLAVMNRLKKAAKSIHEV